MPFGRSVFVASALLLTALPPHVVKAQSLYPALFSEMRWRMIATAAAARSRPWACRASRARSSWA